MERIAERMGKLMRTRNEQGYRDTKAKNGGFSPILSASTAARIAKYCKINNINKTRFVEKCVNERLDVLEQEMFDNMTREELIFFARQQY